jgi:predicted HD superfamily hydrolase involved in NAD metabolism
MVIADEQIRIRLRRMISHRRYIHSLGVENTAAELALRYGLDVNQAALAGLLHDCGKDLRKEVRGDLEYLLGEYRGEKSDALYHAPLGADIAQQIFGIDDPEILSAIKKHTLGGPGMTDLEKIVYLADFFEPGRRYPGMMAIKEATMVSLDNGLLEAARQTIRHLLDKQVPIQLDVVEMYNEILHTMESEA